MISNKLYDVLKYIALIALPAFGSFWMVVGAIWGAPHTDEVVKTIVALATLLGALLVLTNVQYNNSDRRFDGFVTVQETPEGQDNQITHFDTPNKTVEDMQDKGHILLKVQTEKQ